MDIYKVLMAIAMVIVLIMSFISVTKPVVDEDELLVKVSELIDNKILTIESASLTEEEKAVLAAEIASLIAIPEVENADNDMLNEYLKIHFSAEFEAIESNALEDVINELEDDDFKELLDFLSANIEGLDKDSVDVDVDEEEVKVLLLGLGEDEDKSAEVLLELDVEYSLLTGIVADYRLPVFVKATVIYDEGDFNDEEVNLIFSFE